MNGKVGVKYLQTGEGFGSPDCVFERKPDDKTLISSLFTYPYICL